MDGGLIWMEAAGERKVPFAYRLRGRIRRHAETAKCASLVAQHVQH
jgi:hypothetical protein